MKAPIKLVWITGFSSSEIQEVIKPKKESQPFAPWIPAAIKSFKGDNRYDLHVISAHYYISRNKKFSDGNITYHFFNQGIPFLGNGFPKWLLIDHWIKYLNLRIPALKILRKINPDIIHFWGAEIPIASVFLDLNDDERAKSIISVQGFKIEDGINAAPSVRVQLQNDVLKKGKLFYTTCDWMNKKVLDLNPKAKFTPLIYPINLPKYDASIAKKYDLLFYARVTRSKGIEDLLDALHLIKQKAIDLTLLIMGPCSKEYESELKAKAESLGVLNQITWAGFMRTQEELYRKAQEAKIYVLPTHSEILAGTVRESMAMKLPVITNKVGCLPVLNESQENVFLVEK